MTGRMLATVKELVGSPSTLTPDTVTAVVLLRLSRKHRCVKSEPTSCGTVFGHNGPRAVGDGQPVDLGQQATVGPHRGEEGDAGGGDDDPAQRQHYSGGNRRQSQRARGHRRDGRIEQALNGAGGIGSENGLDHRRDRIEHEIEGRAHGRHRGQRSGAGGDREDDLTDVVHAGRGHEAKRQGVGEANGHSGTGAGDVAEADRVQQVRRDGGHPADADGDFARAQGRRGDSGDDEIGSGVFGGENGTEASGSAARSVLLTTIAAAAPISISPAGSPGEPGGRGQRAGAEQWAVGHGAGGLADVDATEAPPTESAWMNLIRLPAVARDSISRCPVGGRSSHSCPSDGKETIAPGAGRITTSVS